MFGAEVLPAKGFGAFQKVDRKFWLADIAIRGANRLQNLGLDQGLLREARFDTVRRQFFGGTVEQFANRRVQGRPGRGLACL